MNTIESNGPSDASLIELGRKLFALHGGEGEVCVFAYPATNEVWSDGFRLHYDCTPDRVEVYVKNVGRLAEGAGHTMVTARERVCVELLRRMREMGESTDLTAEEIEAAAVTA